MNAKQYRLLTVALPLPNVGVSVSLELFEYMRVRYILVGSPHGSLSDTLTMEFQVGTVLAYVVQEDFTSYPHYRPSTESKTHQGRTYLIAAVPLPKGLILSLASSPLAFNRDTPQHYRGFSWDYAMFEEYIPLGEPKAEFDPAVGAVVLTQDVKPYDRIWIASPTKEKLKTIHPDTNWDLFTYPEDLFARNLQHLVQLWRTVNVTILPDLWNSPQSFFAVENTFMMMSLFSLDEDNPFAVPTRGMRPALRALRSYLHQFFLEITTVAPPANKPQDHTGQLGSHIASTGLREVETWFRERQDHPWYLNINLALDKPIMILRQRVSLLIEYQRLTLRTPVGPFYERAPSADWQRKPAVETPPTDRSMIIFSFPRPKSTRPATPGSTASSYSTPRKDSSSTAPSSEAGDSITLTPLSLSSERCGTLDASDGVQAVCGIPPAPLPLLCLGQRTLHPPPCSGAVDPTTQLCPIHHAIWLDLIPEVRDAIFDHEPLKSPLPVYGEIDPALSMWEYLLPNASTLSLECLDGSSWCLGFLIHPRWAPDRSPRIVTVVGTATMVHDLSNPFAGPALQITWSSPPSDPSITPSVATSSTSKDLSFALWRQFTSIWPRMLSSFFDLESHIFTFPNVQLLAWSTNRARFWEDTISSSRTPLVTLLLGPCRPDTPRTLRDAVRIDLSTGINFWGEVGDRWIAPPQTPIPTVPLSAFPVEPTFTPLRPPRPATPKKPPSTAERLFTRLASPSTMDRLLQRVTSPSPTGRIPLSPRSSAEDYFPTPNTRSRSRGPVSQVLASCNNRFGYPSLRPIGPPPPNTPRLFGEPPISSQDWVGNNEGGGEGEAPGSPRHEEGTPLRRERGPSGVTSRKKGRSSVEAPVQEDFPGPSPHTEGSTLATLIGEMQRASKQQARIAEQEVLLKELENEALLFGDKKSSGGVTAAEIHHIWKKVALVKKGVGLKGYKYGGVELVGGPFAYHLVETFNSGAGVLGTRAFWQERPYLIPTSLLVAIGLDDWCPGRGIDPGMLTPCHSLDTLMNPLKHRSGVTNPLPKPGPTCHKYLEKMSWSEVEKRYQCIFRLYGDAWGEFWYEVYSQAFKEFCTLRLTDYYYFSETRSVRIFQKCCWDFQRLLLQLVSHSGTTPPESEDPHHPAVSPLMLPTPPPYASIQSVYDIKDLSLLISSLPGFSFDPLNPDSEYFLTRIYEERDGVINTWQGKQLAKYLTTQEAQAHPPKSSGVGSMNEKPSYLDLERKFPRAREEKEAFYDALSSIVSDLGIDPSKSLCLRSLSVDGCDLAAGECPRFHLPGKEASKLKVPPLVERYLVRYGGSKGTYSDKPLQTFEQRRQAFKMLRKQLPKALL